MLSSPGLTGRSSKHRPWILDCPVKPGKDTDRISLKGKCCSEGSTPWSMWEAVSAGEYVIGPRDREIVRASVIVVCARKPPALRLWLLFAFLFSKCIGRSRPPSLQAQTLLREGFAEIAGRRSHIVRLMDR